MDKQEGNELNGNQASNQSMASPEPDIFQAIWQHNFSHVQHIEVLDLDVEEYLRGLHPQSTERNEEQQNSGNIHVISATHSNNYVNQNNRDFVNQNEMHEQSQLQSHSMKKEVKAAQHGVENSRISRLSNNSVRKYRRMSLPRSQNGQESVSTAADQLSMEQGEKEIIDVNSQMAQSQRVTRGGKNCGDMGEKGNNNAGRLMTESPLQESVRSTSQNGAQGHSITTQISAKQVNRPKSAPASTSSLNHRPPASPQSYESMIAEHIRKTSPLLITPITTGMKPADILKLKSKKIKKADMIRIAKSKPWMWNFGPVYRRKHRYFKPFLIPLAVRRRLTSNWRQRSNQIKRKWYFWFYKQITKKNKNYKILIRKRNKKKVFILKLRKTDQLTGNSMNVNEQTIKRSQIEIDRNTDSTNDVVGSSEQGKNMRKRGVAGLEDVFSQKVRDDSKRIRIEERAIPSVLPLIEEQVRAEDPLATNRASTSERNDALKTHQAAGNIDNSNMNHEEGFSSSHQLYNRGSLGHYNEDPAVWDEDSNNGLDYQQEEAEQDNREAQREDSDSSPDDALMRAVYRHVSLSPEQLPDIQEEDDDPDDPLFIEAEQFDINDYVEGIPNNDIAALMENEFGPDWAEGIPNEMMPENYNDEIEIPEEYDEIDNQSEDEDNDVNEAGREEEAIIEDNQYDNWMNDEIAEAIQAEEYLDEFGEERISGNINMSHSLAGPSVSYYQNEPIATATNESAYYAHAPQPLLSNQALVGQHNIMGNLSGNAPNAEMNQISQQLNQQHQIPPQYAENNVDDAQNPSNVVDPSSREASNDQQSSSGAFFRAAVTPDANEKEIRPKLTLGYNFNREQIHPGYCRRAQRNEDCNESKTVSKPEKPNKSSAEQKDGLQGNQQSLSSVQQTSPTPDKCTKRMYHKAKIKERTERRNRRKEEEKKKFLQFMLQRTAEHSLFTVKQIEEPEFLKEAKAYTNEVEAHPTESIKQEPSDQQPQLCYGNPMELYISNYRSIEDDKRNESRKKGEKKDSTLPTADSYNACFNQLFDGTMCLDKDQAIRSSFKNFEQELKSFEVGSIDEEVFAGCPPLDSDEEFPIEDIMKQDDGPEVITLDDHQSLLKNPMFINVTSDEFLLRASDWLIETWEKRAEEDGLTSMEKMDSYIEKLKTFLVEGFPDDQKEKYDDWNSDYYDEEDMYFSDEEEKEEYSEEEEEIEKLGHISIRSGEKEQAKYLRQAKGNNEENENIKPAQPRFEDKAKDEKGRQNENFVRVLPSEIQCRGEREDNSYMDKKSVKVRKETERLTNTGMRVQLRNTVDEDNYKTYDDESNEEEVDGDEQEEEEIIYDDDGEDSFREEDEANEEEGNEYLLEGEADIMDEDEYYGEEEEYVEHIDNPTLSKEDIQGEYSDDNSEYINGSEYLVSDKEDIDGMNANLTMMKREVAAVEKILKELLISNEENMEDDIDWEGYEFAEQNFVPEGLVDDEEEEQVEEEDEEGPIIEDDIEEPIDDQQISDEEESEIVEDSFQEVVRDVANNDNAVHVTSTIESRVIEAPALFTLSDTRVKLDLDDIDLAQYIPPGMNIIGRLEEIERCIEDFEDEKIEYLDECEEAIDKAVQQLEEINKVVRMFYVDGHKLPCLCEEKSRKRKKHRRRRNVSGSVQIDKKMHKVGQCAASEPFVSQDGEKMDTTSEVQILNTEEDDIMMDVDADPIFVYDDDVEMEEDDIPQQQIKPIIPAFLTQAEMQHVEKINQQIIANEPNVKYEKKCRVLKNKMKTLIYENAACVDEVSRLNHRIYGTTEERKVLARRMCHHYRNYIRRLQNAKKRLEMRKKKLIELKASGLYVRRKKISSKPKDKNNSSMPIETVNPPSTKSTPKDLKKPSPKEQKKRVYKKKPVTKVNKMSKPLKKTKVDVIKPTKVATVETPSLLSTDDSTLPSEKQLVAPLAKNNVDAANNTSLTKTINHNVDEEELQSSKPKKTRNPKPKLQKVQKHKIPPPEPKSKRPSRSSAEKARTQINAQSRSFYEDSAELTSDMSSNKADVIEQPSKRGRNRSGSQRKITDAPEGRLNREQSTEAKDADVEKPKRGRNRSGSQRKNLEVIVNNVEEEKHTEKANSQETKPTDITPPIRKIKKKTELESLATWMVSAPIKTGRSHRGGAIPQYEELNEEGSENYYDDKDESFILETPRRRVRQAVVAKPKKIKKEKKSVPKTTRSQRVVAENDNGDTSNELNNFETSEEAKTVDDETEADLTLTPKKNQKKGRKSRTPKHSEGDVSTHEVDSPKPKRATSKRKS